MEPTEEAVDSLIVLFGKSLDLSDFDEGVKVFQYLLRKNKKLVNIDRFYELLANQRDHPAVRRLLQDLISDNPLLDPLAALNVQEALDQGMSVKEALAELFASKDGADFEILIECIEPNPSKKRKLLGSNSDKGKSEEDKRSFKCHRFILQDRWPYFAGMNKEMREAQEGRLSLPAVGEPDGMHPIVLAALLEVCYTGAISKQTRELITPDVAMHLLSAPIYFKTGAVLDDDGKVGVDPPFRELYALAERQFVSGITAENCVDLLKMALSLRNEDVAAKVKQMILQNRRTLRVDPTFLKSLHTLPVEVLVDFLWKQLRCRVPIVVNMLVQINPGRSTPSGHIIGIDQY